MNLSFVELSGFRGYTSPLRIEFATGFTVIDGRNGVGKSTISDAVEFALTGTISKYRGASSDKERVEDYLWFRGGGEALAHPSAHYVEVGFSNEADLFTIRRERVNSNSSSDIDKIASLLTKEELAPGDALLQLCSASIIRDEHIADLSLDMKDTERYSLLREAIGASDADVWIERARQLHNRMKSKREAAEQEAAAAGKFVSQAEIQLDQVRASQPAEAVISDARNRLISFIGEGARADGIVASARTRLSDLVQRLEGLRQLDEDRVEISELLIRSVDQLEEITRQEQIVAGLREEVQRLEELVGTSGPSDAIAQRAKDLAALAAIGHRVGLGDHQNCPLCDAARTADQFARGIELAQELADKLDQQAADQARVEQEMTDKQAELRRQFGLELEMRKSYDLTAGRISEFQRRREELALGSEDALARLPEVIATLERQIATARNDLRTTQAADIGPTMLRNQTALEKGRQRQSQAEERLGNALSAERTSQAMLDAARRAASEALDARLDRVLPLMAELYRRLRPHPIWDNIEYRIRGDVRKFLRLQVGDDLNPQFMFSSGQRRAAGLAFLLSVNLSLGWSNWRTIMLDDPVQHIDDFRSIHLAEVLSHLVSSGRQVICSVEDPALADFLCRRLPVSEFGGGKRVSLGPDENGVLTKLEERILPPMPQGSLVAA